MTLRQLVTGTRGSTVITVLMGGLVLTLVAVALGTVGQINAHDAHRNENTVRAHFYAKSGVEVAVGIIKQNILTDPGYLLNQAPVSYQGSLDGTGFRKVTTSEDSMHNIEFTISREEDEYYIDSIGIVRTGTQGSRVSANAVGYQVSAGDILASIGFGGGVGGGGGAGGGNPLALFAMNRLEMSGNGRIRGHVGTNAVALNTVKFKNNNRILGGDLDIGPGGLPTVVVNTARADGTSPNIPNGVIGNLPSPRQYPLPGFPTFPSSLTSRTSLKSGHNVINENGQYGEISSAVTIVVGNTDRLIRVNTLSISGNDHWVIDRRGTGRVYLYVDGSISLSGNANVNVNGDSNSLVIIHRGSSDIKITGNNNINANIVIESAELAVSGNATIYGDIVSGGSKVTISGNLTTQNRILYAPNAHLKVSGNGRLIGTAIVGTAYIDGNGEIRSNPSLDPAFFNSLDWKGSPPPSLTTTGESRPEGTWQFMGRWSPRAI